MREKTLRCPGRDTPPAALSIPSSTVDFVNLQNLFSVSQMVGITIVSTCGCHLGENLRNSCRAGFDKEIATRVWKQSRRVHEADMRHSRRQMPVIGATSQRTLTQPQPWIIRNSNIISDLLVFFLFYCKNAVSIIHPRQRLTLLTILCWTYSPAAPFGR